MDDPKFVAVILIGAFVMAFWLYAEFTWGAFS